MELLRNKQSNIIGAPNIIHSSIKLTGHVQCFVRRADCPDVNKLEFEGANIIDFALKEFFRDTMNSSVDAALDNLRATQSQVGTIADDGITLFNALGTVLATYVGIMASAVHPTDPSGDFYRQWQGVWQEPSATEEIVVAVLGHDLDDPTVSPENFDPYYATEDIIPTINLVLNDILTINWKISVG